MDTRRQNLLVRNPEHVSAVVVGAGSIGSTTCALLARTGIGNISLYDDDVLNEWNLSGGIFDRSMMGEPKVESVRSIVSRLTGRTIDIVQEKYVGQKESADVVIVGTDSLTSREEILKYWGRQLDTRFLIDARMGGHICEVFSLDGSERLDSYRKSLNVDVQPATCGTEATSYVIEHCISLIGRTIRGICNQEAFPYRQYWDAENDATFVSRVAVPA